MSCAILQHSWSSETIHFLCRLRHQRIYFRSEANPCCRCPPSAKNKEKETVTLLGKHTAQGQHTSSFLSCNLYSSPPSLLFSLFTQALTLLSYALSIYIYLLLVRINLVLKAWITGYVPPCKTLNNGTRLSVSFTAEKQGALHEGGEGRLAWQVGGPH